MTRQKLLTLEEALKLSKTLNKEGYSTTSIGYGYEDNPDIQFYREKDNVRETLMENGSWVVGTW